MISEEEIEQIIHDHDIKLLIFDCDGTLMETLSLHYQAWNEAFQHYGYKFITQDEFITEYAGVSGGEMVSAVIAKFAYALDSNIILSYKKKVFLDKYVYHVKPIATTLNIAKKYHGKLKMVVASGGAKEAVIKMLTLNNLLALFEQVITIEDVSRGKPAPDIFLTAAAAQKISPANCLVFEDHFAGFNAAIRAGMHFIDVQKLSNKD